MIFMHLVRVSWQSSQFCLPFFDFYKGDDDEDAFVNKWFRAL